MVELITTSADVRPAEQVERTASLLDRLATVLLLGALPLAFVLGVVLGNASLCEEFSRCEGARLNAFAATTVAIAFAIPLLALGALANGLAVGLRALAAALPTPPTPAPAEDRPARLGAAQRGEHPPTGGADWYPDPWGGARFHRRRWDGAAWTDEVDPPRTDGP